MCDCLCADAFGVDAEKQAPKSNAGDSEAFDVDIEAA